jgi:hypothetical protein
MVWLFGQIWLWLLIAFVLGALTSWLFLRTTQRPRPEEPAPEAPEPEAAAERTQFIPAAWAQQERPPAHHDYEDDEPEPAGHREGHLPLPPQRGADAEDWPTEDEPAWPESEDAWPHQPGRGG